MISANELRIGNYLKNDRVIVKIDARSIFDIWDSSKKYEPIQITEEWLLKFGFIQEIESGIKFDEYSKGFITLGGVVSGEKLYQLIYDGKCFLTFLQYIHQLQNLYFALTGKELEIK